jgi:uncharacterized RDD family membrane protein YckC
VLVCEGSTGTSAAQNGPVIRICPKCGALLLRQNVNCSVCEPASETEDLHKVVPSPVAVGVGESEWVAEPEWRREVTRRLREYRARRYPNGVDDSQSGLPFHEEVPLEEPEQPPRRVRSRSNLRARQAERVEICVQPELDFSSGDRAHPQSPLVPVASLPERRFAGAIDAALLALTCAGFVGLFRSMGGQISLAKVDAVIYLAVAGLIYGLYFFIFTTLAGSTPGMQLRGLTVVRMDGSLPDTRQLLWRSFGYLVSATALTLGFVWALWDEDRFTWHDRISQTYVTAASPVIVPEPVELPPGDLHPRRGVLAHR